MKTKIALASCLLLIYATSHAMELVPLTSTKKKNFQIHCIQDIPKLPLKYIRPCFNLLPERKRNELLATKNKNGIPLAESLTFNVACFPEENVQLHILTLMMDGDELSAQLFHKAPLWYAHQRYHDAPDSLVFRLYDEKEIDLSTEEIECIEKKCGYKINPLKILIIGGGIAGTISGTLFATYLLINSINNQCPSSNTSSLPYNNSHNNSSKCYSEGRVIFNGMFLYSFFPSISGVLGSLATGITHDLLYSLYRRLR